MTATLRVDWPACQRRGLCAEVLPEILSLDEWGYPLVEGGVTRELLELAEVAASVCPHSALRLLRDR
ncbi:MAG: ferredoxin [Lapillicoccus sp.]